MKFKAETSTKILVHRKSRHARMNHQNTLWVRSKHTASAVAAHTLLLTHLMHEMHSIPSSVSVPAVSGLQQRQDSSRCNADQVCLPTNLISYAIYSCSNSVSIDTFRGVTFWCRQVLELSVLAISLPDQASEFHAYSFFRYAASQLA